MHTLFKKLPNLLSLTFRITLSILPKDTVRDVPVLQLTALAGVMACEYLDKLYLTRN